jgi:hypothetical protein
MGFIAHRVENRPECPQFFLVDCNRLIDQSPIAFFGLLRNALAGGPQEENPSNAADHLVSLGAAIESRLRLQTGICLLVDRFDSLMDWPDFKSIANSLRAFRDAHKYQLTYVIATRKELDPGTELSELFFGHTFWLSPLERGDALWSANRDIQRFMAPGKMDLNRDNLEKLVELTWGYPSLLRAACEAYASGAPVQEDALLKHPAIQRRVMEFWDDQPDENALIKSGLKGHPLLKQTQSSRSGLLLDTRRLTSKENLLLEYFQEHRDAVCEKDDLVRAVWPEDFIFEQGVRDDSLAQLVRRLRIKIEPDPSQPKYIQTVPGRGYIFKP